MEWQPIETAPKTGKAVLLYGATQEDSNNVRYLTKVVFSGYWEPLDSAWCAHGSHWDGPFFDVTHWMPLPEAPK